MSVKSCSLLNLNDCISIVDRNDGWILEWQSSSARRVRRSFCGLIVIFMGDNVYYALFCERNSVMAKGKSIGTLV